MIAAILVGVLIGEAKARRVDRQDLIGSASDEEDS
jgi:hypothetical protein